MSMVFLAMLLLAPVVGVALFLVMVAAIAVAVLAGAVAYRQVVLAEIQLSNSKSVPFIRDEDQEPENDKDKGPIHYGLDGRVVTQAELEAVERDMFDNNPSVTSAWEASTRGYSGVTNVNELLR